MNRSALPIVYQDMMTLPNALRYTTLDEAAECLAVSSATSAALWALMPDDKDIPPQGEWPEPDSANREVRSLRKFWGKLTQEQQAEILNAAKKEGWIK